MNDVLFAFLMMFISVVIAILLAFSVFCFSEIEITLQTRHSLHHIWVRGWEYLTKYRKEGWKILVD